MADKNITYDDLMSELLASVGDGKKPKPEEGWFTIDQVETCAKDLSYEQLRDRMVKGCKIGTHERAYWGREVYYRVKQNKECET